jgi:hypothetical protein
MPRKKPARKKKIASKTKSSSKKKIAAKKRAAVQAKAAPRKSVARKSAGKKKSAANAPKRKKPARARSRMISSSRVTHPTPSGLRGLGPESGGQSGDTQGISRRESEDSESVEELLEEGQYAEAGAVSGVENAPDADQGEVRTREFPEDDVPQEYLDED